MREIIVDNNVCNNDYYTELNLSFFSSLRVFEVGDYSLLFVKEVKLITLSQLERVVIGNTPSGEALVMIQLAISI